MTVGILLPPEAGPMVYSFTDDDPKNLQQAVDGFWEIITLPSGMNLVVNEDGQALNLKVNDSASRIAGRLIVGQAVLCGEIRKGKFTSLSASIIKQYVPD